MLNIARNISGVTGNWQRPNLVWPATFIATIVLLAVTNYYVLVTLRHDIITREEEVLDRMGEATARAIEGVIDVTALALENLDNTVLTHRTDGKEIHETLKLVTQSLPFLRMTSVFDASGNLVHSALRYPPLPLNLAQRDYFAYYVNGGQARYTISGLSRNATDGRWQVAMVRALREPSGALRGLQSAVIDNYYLYEAFLRGEHDAYVSGPLVGHHHYYFTLLDSKMQLVARSPWNEDDVGKSFSGAPLLQALVKSGQQEMRGVFPDLLIADQRVSVVRWVADKQLVLSVSCELGMVLTYWRTTALGSAGGSVALLIMLGFAWWRAARERRIQTEHLNDLGRINVEKERLAKRAEESARAKSTFLANMSHEMRTPLNSILGYSGLALEDKNLSEDSRRFIKQVFTASNNLRVIIDDVLNLSTIEAGKVTLVATAFSISELADNCKSIIDPLAKAKGLALRVLVDPKLPAWLSGDETRIQQVLLNLANNAVKFTHEGFVEIAVTCRGVAGKRASIHFAVRDTGIGIAEDKLALLFQRFQQTDESISRRYGGTGLGLAISKALVSMMGGSIGVDSTPGIGSTFWFTLSLPVAAQPMAAGVAGPASGEKDATSPLRVLVVDDLEINCDLVKMLLERAGHHVDTASDGAEAVNACANRSYDLLLMDVRMPGMDGLEATRQIRELGDAGRKVPIIAMTANVMPDQLALYLAAGMNGCLAKPIDRDQLFALFERWRRPAESEQGGVSAEQPVHDRAMFSAVCEALGPERASGFARTLEEKLAAGIWKGEPVGNEDLMHAAHAVVSLAGQLGFSEISAAARRLEEAILDKGDIQGALAAFRSATARAIPVFAQLAAENSPPGRPAAAAAGG